MRWTGTGIETIADIFENPYLLPVSTPGIYTLTGFTDAFCFGDFGGIGTVGETGGELEYTATPSTCFKIADGTIIWTVLGGSPPFSAQWSPSVNDPLNPNELLAGDYAVTITDSLGCQIMDTIIISTDLAQDPDCKPFNLFAPNAFSPNNDGFNDDFRLYPSSDSNIALIKSMHIFNRWGGLVLKKRTSLPMPECNFGTALLKVKKWMPGYMYGKWFWNWRMALRRYWREMSLW